MDWGTRRKPLGAIVAWSSLAIFAVLTVLGIAGVVMGLQPAPGSLPDSTQQTAALAVEPAPAPAEERLPEELSFADAQAAEAVAATQPTIEVASTTDAIIASTFDQLVEPVTVPADQVPAGAVPVNVADAGPQLPMSPEHSALTARPVSRNAAAWAIETEVPDDSRRTTALGYAAQPDDTVRVGDSSINVRSGPSQANKRLFSLESGEEVDVTGKVSGKSGDWVAITDAKDRDGWVDASLLDNVDLKSLPVVKNAPAAEPEVATSLKKVASSGVTVRSGPGKSSKQLFNLSGGSSVSVLDEQKGWLKIKDGDGRTGWAYKSYIR